MIPTLIGGMRRALGPWDLGMMAGSSQLVMVVIHPVMVVVLAIFFWPNMTHFDVWEDVVRKWSEIETDEFRNSAFGLMFASAGTTTTRFESRHRLGVPSLQEDGLFYI